MENKFELGVIPKKQEHISKPVVSTWSGTDNLKNFKKYLSNCASKGIEPDYTPDSFEYRFNTYGWRTHEFVELTNTILCFGCSFTEGVGVDEPWPVLLEKEFPTHTIYNFGLPGASSDTIARLAANTIPYFNPEFVFILWPSAARFEVLTKGDFGAKFNRFEFLGPWSKIGESIDLLSDPHATHRLHKNKLMVNLLANVYGVKAVFSEDAEQLLDFNKNQEDAKLPSPAGLKEFFQSIDLARDGQHPGKKTQEYFKQKMLTQYTRYYDNQ
jgi:hypothetical protein